MQQWSGLASLLAFTRFEEENQRLLELNQRCQFAASAAMQWLDIRLQLMGATVVSAIAGIALVQHQQGLANPGATSLPRSFTLTSEACCPFTPDLSPPTFHLPPRGPGRSVVILIACIVELRKLSPREKLAQVVVGLGLELSLLIFTPFLLFPIPSTLSGPSSMVFPCSLSRPIVLPCGQPPVVPI